MYCSGCGTNLTAEQEADVTKYIQPICTGCGALLGYVDTEKPADAQ